MVRLAFNYMGFSRFANRVARKGNFDMVQVEWVESALFMKKGACPMVLDAHDVITKPAERLMKKGRGLSRLLLALRYWCIKNLELRIARRFDMVFTLSEYDRNYLVHMEPRLKVKTIPIPAGMDITGRTFDRAKHTILFLASYKYRRVNVDAALFFYREVFPLIRKSVPDARFIIAGYGPPEDLTSLQEKDPHVIVTCFVEDIDECYKKASVFVAPVLVGGGIIVKILDAMAAATPVVTTSFGNEGIAAKPGRDLLVADDPKEFAAAVRELLKDPAHAEEIGKNGQAFVKNNFSLEAVMTRIEAAYGELVNGK
jgi:glycosyltransferase involved in cell wall biosynthesis